MNQVRIIGIGSPSGDDCIGWEAVEAIEASGILARFPPGAVDTCSCSRPGGGLLSLFEGAQTVIVIDAMVSGAPAGTVRRFEQDELMLTQTFCSSHGISVAETVALGKALNQLPETLLFYGIEAQCLEPLAKLQPEVRSALAELLSKITQDLETALLQQNENN